jgi:hypothetical protein
MILSDFEKVRESSRILVVEQRYLLFSFDLSNSHQLKEPSTISYKPHQNQRSRHIFPSTEKIKRVVFHRNSMGLSLYQ